MWPRWSRKHITPRSQHSASHLERKTGEKTGEKTGGRLNFVLIIIGHLPVLLVFVRDSYSFRNFNSEVLIFRTIFLHCFSKPSRQLYRFTLFQFGHFIVSSLRISIVNNWARMNFGVVPNWQFKIVRSTAPDTIAVKDFQVGSFNCIIRFYHSTRLRCTLNGFVNGNP